MSEEAKCLKFFNNASARVSMVALTFLRDAFSFSVFVAASVAVCPASM